MSYYAMHSHGYENDRHAHSTTQGHSGDINNPQANNHDGIEIIDWEEFRERYLTKGDERDDHH